MVLVYALIAVVAYAVYRNSELENRHFDERVTKFKNAYFPVEADISDHILRNVPFGFVIGRNPGKLNYENPVPMIVKNEFYSELNEASYGYAAPLTSPAINTAGYQKLIDDQFNIQEHPRLDLTRQDQTKGRYRRSQYAFVDDTE